MEAQTRLDTFKAELRKTIHKMGQGNFCAVSVPHFFDIDLADEAVDYTFKYCEKKGINVKSELRVIGVDNLHIQAIILFAKDDVAIQKLNEFWADSDQKNAFAYQICLQQESYYQSKH